MRNAVLGILVGVILGSFAAGSVFAEREKYSTAFDMHGNKIHVGDVIIGSTGVPIKVHGFTTTYRAGTFAAYSYQVEACPTCQWVETAPESASSNRPAVNESRSILARVADFFVPRVDASGDGDTIIWGS
jgi:hypothetical protein